MSRITFITSMLGFALLILAPGTSLMAQIKLVKDIEKWGNSNPKDLIEFRGKVYFSAYESATGRELYVSDGTAAGTRLLFDISPGRDSGYPGRFIKAGGKLFFGAWTPQLGFELWVTDGVTTRLVKDLAPGKASGLLWQMSLNLLRPLAYRGKLYFYTTLASILWVTDGTSNGTVVAPVQGIVQMLLLGEKVLCRRIRSTSSDGLTITDMTVAGTSYLNVEAYKFRPIIGNAKVYRGKCYFFAYDRKHGIEPWVTDGTRVGTKLLADTTPGNPPVTVWKSPYLRREPQAFMASGDRLFFVFATMAAGEELWVTDGTTRGTHLVSDLSPGKKDSVLRLLGSVGSGKILFDLGRRDLWVSDSTKTGTLRLGGATGPVFVSAPTRAGSRYSWFPAVGASSGTEVWWTDGTRSGTRIYQDYVPGVNHFFPASSTKMGNLLLFAAFTPKTGTELFGLDVGATSSDIGRGCARYRAEPRLGALDPVLGTKIQLSGRDTPLQAPGQKLPMVILLGLQSKQPLSLNSCAIYVDLFKPVPFIEVTSVKTPTWEYSSISIPSTPQLSGISLAVQCAFVLGNGQIATTNGVTLYLGK